MIVVTIKLVSAISYDRDQDLGTMIIDNQPSSTHTRGDYRCRMYRKSDLTKYKDDPRLLVQKGKHIREAMVLNHARLTEPVHNLVSKALIALGYR